jgi:diguanylate cyclase (GGDEF)-like protein
VTRDHDPNAFSEADPDESTAVVHLGSLGKIARLEPKDRHLLVRINGAGRGHVTRLSLEPQRIGRAQDSDIFVADDGVSRRHAVITQVAGAFLLEDKNSANGTFVGGQRIERHVLRDGDTLQFGPTATFRYTLTDAGQEALLRQLFESSVTDALTGTHNREYFDSQLKAELSFARRHKTEVALVLFDVDHFKKVNDTYGHPAGDEVLIRLAHAVRPIVRNEDVFARYGGEEFAVILRGVDINGAASLAERLRATVEAMTIPTERGSIHVTVSIGCASVGGAHDLKPEGMIAQADARLYRAKHAGRNRVAWED